MEVTSYDHLIYVTASNVVIRGLKLDGTRKSATVIQLQGNRNTQSVQNVIIEDNWSVNGGKAGIFFGGLKNIVIRHNIIDSTGLNPSGPDGGSPLYIAGSGSDLPASDVEMYGNVFRNYMYNAADFKSEARNINIHHNIFEINRLTHDGFPGDGLVRSQGSNTSSGNYFQDNIVRDSLSRYIVRIDGNRVDVLDNVFYNIDAGDFINTANTISSAVISGNTLCNTPTGGKRGNNRLNQPQSVCDAEVARITNELKALPGAGSGFPEGGVGTPVFTPGPCSFRGRFLVRVDFIDTSVRPLGLQRFALHHLSGGLGQRLSRLDDFILFGLGCTGPRFRHKPPRRQRLMANQGHQQPDPTPTKHTHQTQARLPPTPALGRA